jgi:hypothetical protein
VKDSRSPQQLFAAKCRQFRHAHHTISPRIEALLEKLASDQRMDQAWKVMAQLPEPKFDAILEAALIASLIPRVAKNARTYLEDGFDRAGRARLAIRATLYELRNIPQTIVTMASGRTLPSVLTKHLRYPRIIVTMASGREPPRDDYSEQQLEVVVAWLERADAALGKFERTLAAAKKRQPRKIVGAPGAEVMRELGAAIEAQLGGPRDEVTAAIASVVLDSPADRPLTGIAARSARRKRKRPIHPKIVSE